MGKTVSSSACFFAINVHFELLTYDPNAQIQMDATQDEENCLQPSRHKPSTQALERQNLIGSNFNSECVLPWAFCYRIEIVPHAMQTFGLCK